MNNLYWARSLVPLLLALASPHEALASSPSLEQKLTPRSSITGEQYGYSVDISDDGSRAVVSGYQSNFVYFYEKDTSTMQWVLEQTIEIPWGLYLQVRLADDFAFVGQPGHRKVQIYRHDGTQWAPHSVVEAPAPNIHLFGDALDARDGTLVVGAPAADNAAGQVYVYDYDVASDVWEPHATPLSGSETNDLDGFGQAVAIDSDRIVVGEPESLTGFGQVYVFERDVVGEFVETTRIDPYDSSSAVGSMEFGISVGIMDDTIVVGAPGKYENPGDNAGTGAVYIYDDDGATWLVTSMLEPWSFDSLLPGPPDEVKHDRFGQSVDIATDRIAVGSPGRYWPGAPRIGKTYRLERYADGTFHHEWETTPCDASAGDRFGTRVALTDQGELLATSFRHNPGVFEAGSVYAYDDAGTSAYACPGEGMELQVGNVYLEGSIDASDPDYPIDRILNLSGRVPNEDPYPGLGYEYAQGLDPVIAGFPLSFEVVDWVIVELRDPDDLDIVVAARPGLLHTDGYVTAPDGVSYLSFDSDRVAPGSYRVAIVHRNHIAYAAPHLSDLEVTGVAWASFYAVYTDPAGVGAYESFARPDGTTLHAMVAGDADSATAQMSDGRIDSLDRSTIWNDRNESGYLSSDVNLDGMVNGQDRVFAWNNRNRAAPFSY